MHITDLVVRHFGLTDAREGVPFATINGVTVVDLECSEGHLRIHLVRDSQLTNVTLEEGSKLAAYYNSLFWYEATTAEKISLSSARFKTSFRVSDGHIKHSVFITTSGEQGQSRESLGMAELEQMAQEIATWHAVRSEAVLSEFKESVRENYENIRKYKTKIQKDILELLHLATTSEVSLYFIQPADVMRKVKVLVDHLRDAETEHEHAVISHGRLTAENCKFDSDGKLVEVTEWENIHLGSPVEDLTNLIISSADTEIRTKLFKKIFQVYLYTLVDLHPPKYQLPDLKRWYREHWARAVVDGIEQLLLTLSENQHSHEVKRTAAHRWESSLNDAVDFLMGNYESDNQQDFFAHKE